jgi:enoyl-CoA hydratase
VPTDDLVLVEVADEVATVTLNRPDARNALNRALRKALPAALAEVDQRDDVAAIVLTGTDPAFCAGLDLKEIAATGQAPGPTPDTAEPEHARGPFPQMTKPVIGAVNGVAITGGFEIALACDFLVASDRARFADTHARVGIMPGWGLTVLLPEAIGFRRAREMSSTGNFLDAATALTWGLVNHVVPHEELLGFAQSLARDVASVARPAVARMMATYDEGSLRDGAGAWALEAEVSIAWQEHGQDLAEFEKTRQAVVDRGRTQV